MTLSSDRRGRVPFALVGVLLLVSASVYATGIADRSQPSIERPAATAMDDVSRDTRPALRAAVRDAARESARAPVTVPADTTAGRALNDSDPFRDAVRLRIATAARAALRDVGREAGDVEASVSLPAVDGSTPSLRRAKRGIELRPVDGGSAMAVTVRNLTLRARDDGRVVAQRRLNVSLTVETPVLALHQRTERYETRLNRDALEGPGLARGLTTRLTAITMARGYGRYAGAPIRNVLGNRHVELSTNAALLAQQHATFGREDPAGARAVDIATVRVGVLDVLGGRHGRAAGATKALLKPNAVDGATADPGTGGFDPAQPESPPINASPDAAADEAYLEVIDDPSAAGSYRVRSTLQTTVLSRTSESPPRPRLSNWTLVDEERRERTVVTTGEEHRSGASTGVVDTVRKVTIHHTVERRWRRNGDVRTTTAEWTETARVAVRVTAAYDPDDAAPTRSTAPLFERGGALDGPNLAGARERAATELVAANGGIDAVAVHVAAGERTKDPLTREHTIAAARPDALEGWIAADRRDLRRELVNVSVSLPREAVASGEANAPARLAAAVRDRREQLVDAPQTYDGAADRARVAARAAYLAQVLAALDARAADARTRNVDYRDELGERTTQGLSELIELGREETTERLGADAHETGATASDDELVVTPDGSPAYLTLQSVDHERVPSVPVDESAHPLTVRTTNWIALPYGDTSDGVVDTLFSGGSRQVSLSAAAGTLIAANRTADGDRGSADAGATADPEATALAANREALTAAVRESTRTAEDDVCVAATTGTGISQRVCRAAVIDARDRWPTLGHRAQAMGNGSYAMAFTDALAAQDVDAATADEAGVRVRVRLRELGAKQGTSVPAATTNRTASAVQQVARQTARNRMSGRLENASQRATRRLTGASRLPAGMPVAPPPYTWIATVNAWSVTVRGEYQRFAVTARGAAPEGGGRTVRYIRDGSTVRFDADGDGTAERLGRNERVNFEASTTVVAVVPPGMPGVGDVDGNRDERSPGWPCPGVQDSEACVDGPE